MALSVYKLLESWFLLRHTVRIFMFFASIATWLQNQGLRFQEVTLMEIMG